MLQAVAVVVLQAELMEIILHQQIRLQQLVKVMAVAKDTTLLVLRRL